MSPRREHAAAGDDCEPSVNLSRRQLLALLGGMLLTKGCAPRLLAAKSDSLGREIERVLAETRGPGMACAIVGPGRVRWSNGLGLADVEHQRADAGRHP